MDIIKINNIQFSYEEILVLEALSFAIKEGTCVGIVGENGAGKSTVLKLILGLLKSNSGEIYVKNTLVSSKNLNQIHHLVGYTFQNSDHQLFMPTVEEEVAFALNNRKMPEKEMEQKVNESLKYVNGFNLKNRAPYKLSGGEKRRVALATVLAMAPEVLIFDEPTIGLDPKSRRIFINLIQTLKETKVIATHDLDLAYECCDRILIMKGGKISADGTVEEILKNQNLLEQNGLELPIRFQ